MSAVQHDPSRSDLLTVVRTATEVGVTREAVREACFALSHLPEDAATLEALLPLVAHTAAEVRYGAAVALAGYGGPAEHALITLSADVDADVRDWATFALGAMSTADTPQIRAALAARVDDSDPDTRAEAVHGLALRRAPGSVRLVEAALRDGYWSKPLLEAAAALGDAGLCPVLESATEADLVFSTGTETLRLHDDLDEALTCCGCAPRNTTRRA